MRPSLSTSAVLAVTAALLSLPVGPTGTASAETFTQHECVSPTDDFCVSALTRDGVDVLASGAYELEQVTYHEGGHDQLDFFVVRSDTGDLTDEDLGHVFSATVQFGDDKPRLFHGSAYDSVTRRWKTADGWRFTVTGTPGEVLNGCTYDYPYSCPETAKPEDRQVEYSGSIDDQEDIEFVSPSENDGVDIINTQLGSDLPTFRSDGAAGVLVNQVWAPHLRSDGTVYHGYSRYRIPYDYITENWSLPDPGTMTSESLIGDAGAGGSTFTFEQDPQGGAIYVTFSDFHFSKRVLRVERGHVDPTRPRHPAAARTTRRSGLVSSDRATPRGARVTAYAARCVTGSGAVVTGRARRPSVAVTGLRPGRRYTCRIRGLSKVGPGAWSARATMRARP